jgi:glycogen operon protein
MRGLMGTLLLSAGIPMITAGDEFGRTQHGNNNAYCHDSPLTWLNWEWQDWQHDMFATTRYLLQLRRDLPALRPMQFGRFGENVPHANEMEWFDATGDTMSPEEWDNANNRTLQYLAATTPVNEPFCRILTVIHGVENPVDVVMPNVADVQFFEPLWFSTHPAPREVPGVLRPGEKIRVGGTSILVFRAKAG